MASTYLMLACMAGALVPRGNHGACLCALATRTGRRRLRAGGASRGGQRRSFLTQQGKGKEAAEACSQGGLACVRWLLRGHVFLGARGRLGWRRLTRSSRALRRLARGRFARGRRGSSPHPSEVESEAERVILMVRQHLHCTRASRGSTGARMVLCAGGAMGVARFPRGVRSLRAVCVAVCVPEGRLP